MPFDEITERVSSSPTKAPASIRLRRRKGGKPSCIIGLRGNLKNELVWKDCDVVLLVGNGDDAGKIRLRKVPRGKGLAPVKSLKHGAVVDLGYVAAFGDAPKVSAAVAGRILDSSVVELTLPDWSAVADDVEEAEDELQPRPRPREELATQRSSPLGGSPYPRPPASPAPKAPAPKPGNGSARDHAAVQTPVEKLGVRVSFYPRPKIALGDDDVQITERQALLLGALTRSLGSIVITGDLVQKMELPMSGGASIVAEEYAALHTRLSGIGLKIRSVPKMGYSLSKE